MPQSPPAVLLQVLLYDGGRMVRQLTRFKDVAYSGTFRSDGRLVAAGGASGLVQVLLTSCPTVFMTAPRHSAFFAFSRNMRSAGHLRELQVL